MLCTGVPGTHHRGVHWVLLRRGSVHWSVGSPQSRLWSHVDVGRHCSGQVTLCGRQVCMCGVSDRIGNIRNCGGGSTGCLNFKSSNLMVALAVFTVPCFSVSDLFVFVCMYMYVWIYVCMCVCVCVWMYGWCTKDKNKKVNEKYMFVIFSLVLHYVCTCVQACVCVSLSICVSVSVCLRMFVSVYMLVYVYFCLDVCIYVYIFQVEWSDA